MTATCSQWQNPFKTEEQRQSDRTYAANLIETADDIAEFEVFVIEFAFTLETTTANQLMKTFFKKATKTIVKKSLFKKLSWASRLGIKSYKNLRKLTKGTGLEVHHLIEQRFASIMGQNPKDMISIALTPTEHEVFTAAWRQLIPYGNGTANASRQIVENAARQIYQNYPEILKALGL